MSDPERVARRATSYRSFFSLLASFMIAGFGDIIAIAIANNISFEAIGIVGAFYTVTFALSALVSVGMMTYRVERRDELQYLQIQLASGLMFGIATALAAGPITTCFGIEQQQRDVLRTMLILLVIYLPIDALTVSAFEMIRLQGKLAQYRRAVVIYYAIFIALDIVFCFGLHDVVLIVAATSIAQIAALAYMLKALDGKRFELVGIEQLRACARYGLPLVAEEAAKRFSLFFVNVCASHLPAELFATHVICLNAATKAEVVDMAYGGALFLRIPQPDITDATLRYARERENLTGYRRDTAWIVCVLGIALTEAFVIATHAEVDLALCLVYSLPYALAFVPMAFSTPYKDFLTIQKQAGKVLASTLAGLPIYYVLPIVGCTLLPPDASLIAFGIAGATQLTIRLILYRRHTNTLDAERKTEQPALSALQQASAPCR